MAPPPRSLRFGTSDGVRASEYWKVTTTRHRPELVLAGSRTGGFFHLTMHEDPRYWHLKLTFPTGEVVERPWKPPRDILPGVRRLMRLLIPQAAVRHQYAGGLPRKVTWYPAPDDEHWVEFSVLHCAAGHPEVRSADVLGSVELADGTEALVTARHTDAEPGSMTVHVPDPEDAKRTLRQPNVAILAHGVDQDGCIWLLQLYASPR
jgi:hypothetical protein